MSEFPRFEDLSRRERQRAQNVQLTLAGMATERTIRYQQPEQGVGYTEEAQVIYLPTEPEPPTAA